MSSRVLHAEFRLAGLPPTARHAELVSASIPVICERVEKWTLKQVQGDAIGCAVEAQKLLGISLEGSVG